MPNPEPRRDRPSVTTPRHDLQLELQIQATGESTQTKILDDASPLGLVGLTKLNVIRRWAISLGLAITSRGYRHKKKKAGGYSHLPLKMIRAFSPSNHGEIKALPPEERE